MTDSSSPPPAPAAPLGIVGRDLRAPRAVGVAGLAFAVLFVGSLLLIHSHPPPGSSAEQVAEWYLRDGRDIGLVGLYLVPFAGIAFLWFLAVLRHRVGHRQDRFFDTVFLGSGLLFVAMMFAAAATAGAPLAAVRFQGAPIPSPEVVGLARALGYTFLYVYAVRAAAVFVIVVSTIGLQTRTLPRWLVLLGYAVALVLLLSVSFFQLVVLLFPAWVCVVSVFVLVTDRVPDSSPA